jgi:hypothetical protein
MRSISGERGTSVPRFFSTVRIGGLTPPARFVGERQGIGSSLRRAYTAKRWIIPPLRRRLPLGATRERVQTHAEEL